MTRYVKHHTRSYRAQCPYFEQ